MATHSSIFACKIPWTEPCGLQSRELQKRHDLVTKQQNHLIYQVPYSNTILCSWNSLLMKYSLLKNIMIIKFTLTFRIMFKTSASLMLRLLVNRRN